GELVVTSITVFTPTYNRKEKLERVYKSLLEQTNSSFLWQIIDDGSTDGTSDIVGEWIRDNIIEISYIKNENGGKASSVNLSLNNTATELWMTLDSDDNLFPQTIEYILEHYPKIKNQNSICGMFPLRSTPDGNPMQKKYLP